MFNDLLLENLFLFISSCFVLNLIVAAYSKKSLCDMQEKIDEWKLKIEDKMSLNFGQIGISFDKLESNIEVIERDLNHIVKLAKDSHKKQKDKLGNMGVEFRKFLTPKGKIKKQHQNNPLAHKCYEKFQILILK